MIEMFDSLKSKLKNLFKKGEKLDAGSVYKEEPEEPAVQETAVPEVPETETPVQ